MAADSRSEKSNFVFIFKLPFPEQSIETGVRRSATLRCGAAQFIKQYKLSPGGRDVVVVLL
jgi:hypothetical protein